MFIMRHKTTGPRLPEAFCETVEDLLPIVRCLAAGEYAVSVGGSIGKGISDKRSDIDLRLFCRESAKKAKYDASIAGLSRRIEYWRASGVEVDDCWVRRIDDVEEDLKKWVSGVAAPHTVVWSLWGYHLPTDIYNQYVIEDPSGILARWKAMLTPYPEELRKAIIRHHSRSLRYWISDYHYENKVHRGDIVFLGSITSRLVHDMLQILYAVGETYYPGDGKNLELLPNGAWVPRDFEARVHQALYPGKGVDAFERQRKSLAYLAADVLAIVDISL